MKKLKMYKTKQKYLYNQIEILYKNIVKVKWMET